ncbi:hypothetical protein JFT64_18430 [Pseudomonas carnis]|jgi:hypothetical protein|uniref:hypothetical protein n=1 Tax=Pseudomonas carnis TaxID=2487355 RepID=UPI0018E818D9|nr:hypothetical protein [Pseudomonas carnis]MBJ2214021.1 hypothetical protein [Pseudomonas carnis]
MDKVLKRLLLAFVLTFSITELSADQVDDSLECSMLTSNTGTFTEPQRNSTACDERTNLEIDTREEKLERSRVILHRLILILLVGAVPPLLYVLMRVLKSR